MKAKGQTLAEFGALSDAESKLLAACRDGTVAIIDESRPEKLTPENYVRANFICFLARGGDGYAPVHANGVLLRGAVIAGNLDLNNARISVPLWLDQCLVLDGQKLGSIILVDAAVDGILSLEGTMLYSLRAYRLRVTKSIHLNDGFSAFGPVHLPGAEIGGQFLCAKAKFEYASGDCLNFEKTTITSDVILDECEAKGSVSFMGAEIGGRFSCAEAKFNSANGPSLHFDGATINKAIFLDKCKAVGEVCFIGAEIGGELSCKGAKFDGGQGACLNFSNAKVKTNVFLDDCEAKGEVRFLGAEIGGQLSCDGAHFEANGGAALTAEGAQIKGSVLIRGIKKDNILKLFKVTGQINLATANIRGGLFIENADLMGNLIFTHLTVEKEFRLRKLKSPLSYSDFGHMRCGVLDDDVDAWGYKNKLNGFVYGAFADAIRQEYPQLQAVSTNAESRIKWLKRQMPRDKQDSYRPQPWRHLQRTLRAMGHDTEAREVGIAHQKVRREYGVIGQPSAGAGYGARLYARTAGALHDLYGHLTGYGYKPLKLAAWMIGVWLICSVIFWSAARGGVMGPASPLILTNAEYRKKCGIDSEYAPSQFSIGYKNNNWYYCFDLPAEFSTFNSIIFSLDLILPPVNLFQSQDWAVRIPSLPDEPGKAIAIDPYIVWFVICFEILFGWLASLMLVAVISGMARNTRDDE